MAGSSSSCAPPSTPCTILPCWAIVPWRRFFISTSGATAVFALRNVLTTAIEALRPHAGEPVDSRTWRVYQILRSRYVEQALQPEVAADLTLSLRQLQREESAAREVLADYLWAAHGLEGKVQEMRAPGGAGQVETSPEPGASAQAPPTLSQELAYLGRSAPLVMADAGDVIGKALETVDPLVRAGNVRMAYVAPRPPLHLNLQTAVLRQALINVAGAAVGCVPGGEVNITVQAGADQLAVDVRAVARDALPEAEAFGDRPAAEGPWEGLQIAAELLGLSHGRLDVLRPEGGRNVFAATIVLPISRPVTVLVIDDNADTLQLFDRYLSGSRYQFVGAQNARQGLALAEQTPPRVIVLDVMMPEQDGWILLGQFREYPRTRGIPIIICTVVPQAQLALSLGAAEFLRKPVSRADLLAALDRQADGPPRETG